MDLTTMRAQRFYRQIDKVHAVYWHLEATFYRQDADTSGRHRGYFAPRLTAVVSSATPRHTRRRRRRR